MSINHLFLGLLESTHAAVQVFGMADGGSLDYTNEQGAWCFVIFVNDGCNTVRGGGEGC